MPSHLRRPADVWSCCSAAAVPAGTDGCPIHTYRHRHLWSRGGFNHSQRAGLKLSQSLEIRRRGNMSSVHGNMCVGDLNHFQMYQERPLQMNSMVNSGRWLARTSQFVLCVIYAQVQWHVSVTPGHLTVLTKHVRAFSFQIMERQMLQTTSTPQTLYRERINAWQYWPTGGRGPTSPSSRLRFWRRFTQTLNILTSTCGRGWRLWLGYRSPEFR